MKTMDELRTELALARQELATAVANSDREDIRLCEQWILDLKYDIGTLAMED